MGIGPQIQGYFLVVVAAFIGGLIVQILFAGWSLPQWRRGQSGGCCNLVKVRPLIRGCAVPPLVGMMLLPLTLYNGIPALFEGLDSTISGHIRRGTFGLVLFRAGLGLDLRLLRKLCRSLVKLAFLPQLAEAVTGAGLSYWLLGLPIALAFAFGYLLAGGSTSVVVPLANELQAEGYGRELSVPTLLVLAVTLDALLALTAVDVLVAVHYQSGDSAGIFGSGPLAAIGLGLFEFFGAIIVGLLLASLLKAFFKCCRASKIPEDPATCSEVFQFWLLLGLCGTALFLPALMWELQNFGYLCIVATTSLLRLLWGKQSTIRKNAVMGRMVHWLYWPGQFFLFGLIGTAVDLRSVDGGALKLILLIIGIGLIMRTLCAFAVLSCCQKFPVRTRWAVSFIWIAEATVQVALASLVSDKEKAQGIAPEDGFGREFATMSVFSILISAPLGGILGGSLAKRWLPRDVPSRASVVSLKVKQDPREKSSTERLSLKD